jgi:amino acid permease
VAEPLLTLSAAHASISLAMASSRSRWHALFQRAFHRKSLSEDGAPKQHLKRVLGVGALTLMGVGGSIGAGELAQSLLDLS